MQKLNYICVVFVSFTLFIISAVSIFHFDLFPSYIPVSSQNGKCMMKWALGGNTEAGVFWGECTCLGPPFTLI